MLFCSYAFLLFFAVVFSLYWAIPWKRTRVWLLLIASYIFYASWNNWLALIIFFSASLDFGLAHGIRALNAGWKRKLLVGVSVAANLGLLCYFKYVNFFLDSLQEALRAWRPETTLSTLSVILPIGISFYTFEAISYIVDVYRGRIQPERNLANFLLFILFFPHLVAGPIVRARDFLPQIRRAKRFSWLRAHVGIQYLLIGLIKKLVIADRLALFVDPVFANPGDFDCAAVWCATIAYALQIYCDFSGYTDMALACAHLLGYHLARNFNMPYLARNVSEFWRRWHISLSTWLRDYLFVPLGGSRGSAWLTCRNLLITMTLGGLWHGASWNFALWGLLHGLLLIGHRAFQAVCKRWTILSVVLESPPGVVYRIALTSLCVCLCWVPFRAQTFEQTRKIFHQLFHVDSLGLSYPLPVGGFLLALGFLVMGHLLSQRQIWQRLAVRLPTPALGMVYAAGMALALLLAPPAGKAFIYFQF